MWYNICNTWFLDINIIISNAACFIYIETYTERDKNQTSFSHSTYGEIAAAIIHLNNTVFAYSAAVVFSNDSSSTSCAVLFADGSGHLTATSKFTNRYMYAVGDNFC